MKSRSDFSVYTYSAAQQRRMREAMLRVSDLGRIHPVPSQTIAPQLHIDPALQDALKPCDARPRRFAILDASRLFGLPEILESSGCEHACLFQGDTAEDLGDAAPWLVDLSADPALYFDLLTEGDELSRHWGQAGA